MIFWDRIQGPWRRTPRHTDTSAGYIDVQAWADQGRLAELAGLGIYEEYLHDDGKPVTRGYQEPVVENISGRDRAARYPAGTDAARIGDVRQQKTVEIDAQVPNGTARDLSEDPLLDADIVAWSAGASERKSELEDTDDAGVEAFDVTVTPSPADGAGYVQARMRTQIARVEPWAGQPTNDLAIVCVLRIVDASQAALGSEARAHMFGPSDGPAGAVMPFAQDPADPTVWASRTQDGRMWADEQQTASMRLLWGSGSLPVAETKELQGFGDRHTAVVRYGLP